MPPETVVVGKGNLVAQLQTYLDIHCRGCSAHAGALLEKQVVMFCPNIGLLSTCVLSLIPLLRPFSWHSFLMPVLPDKLLGFLEAPVPFIIGVQVSHTLPASLTLVPLLQASVVMLPHFKPSSILMDDMQCILVQFCLMWRTAVMCTYQRS